MDEEKCPCVYKRLDNVCLHRDIAEVICPLFETCKKFEKKLYDPFDLMLNLVNGKIVAPTQEDYEKFYEQAIRFIKNYSYNKIISYQELHTHC